jgi:hypothetical protein
MPRHLTRITELAAGEERLIGCCLCFQFPASASQITRDEAFVAGLPHLLDAEEEAAVGGFAGVGPDEDLAMEDAAGVDERPAFDEGDVPFEFMQ